MRTLLSLILALAISLSVPARTEPARLDAGSTGIGPLPVAALRLAVIASLAPEHEGEARWSIECANLRVSISVPDRRHAVEQYGARARVAVSDRGIEVASAEVECDDAYATLKIICDGGQARVLAGFAEAAEVASGLPLILGGAGEEAAVEAQQPMLCRRLSLLSLDCEAPRICPVEDFKPADPYEGYWAYLDRDIDPDAAAPGGKYTLATVRRPEGGYWIVYIDGDDSGAWRPMMVKGLMQPTIFAGHFDMQWLDSRGVWLADDNTAQISPDRSTLTLRFPLYRSQLRFSRIK